MAAVENFSAFMTPADIDTMDNWAMTMQPTEADIPVPAPSDQSILDELSLIESATPNVPQQQHQQQQQQTQPFIPHQPQHMPQQHMPPQHMPQQHHHLQPQTHQVQQQQPHQQLPPYSGQAPAQTSLNIDQVPQYQSHSLAHQISSPVTPTCSAPLPSPLKRKSPCGLTPLGPQSKKRTLLSNFGTAMAKSEPLLVSEPLTPSSSHRALHPLTAFATPGPSPATVPPMPSLPAPTTSPCESSCTDDEEVAAPAFPSSPLPAPTAAAAAKRRQMRSRALAASRARATGAKREPTVVSSKNGGGSGASAPSTPPPGGCQEEEAEPMDKKVARAIRNRQAAQRSRVEAKAKMARLADDNVGLANEVEKLTAENADLNKQLQQLMQATFGGKACIEEVLETFKAAKESRSSS